MAGIHQTLKEARSLYAEALKLREAVLASHRDLKGCVAQVQTSRVRLKYLGQGFLVCCRRDYFNKFVGPEAARSLW